MRHPKRFEVSFTLLQGEQFTYRVVTFNGLEKAIALAATEHDREESYDREIFRVKVEDLGVVAFVDGRHDIGGEELVDRQEW